MKLFVVFIITIVSSVLLMSNGNTYAVNPSYQFFTNGSNPFGTSYQEWIGKWWGWWFGIPDNIHPAKDYDSKRCSVMQGGPVWFLYDIEDEKVKTDCTVPRGQGILLPISTTMCDRGIVPEGDLKSCADNIITPLPLINVTVDGKRLDVKNLKAKTEQFNITIPQNLYKGFADPSPKPGSYPAYATGYFLLLHDLSPGMHKIDLFVKDRLLQKDPHTGLNTGQAQDQPARWGHFNILVK